MHDEHETLFSLVTVRRDCLYLEAKNRRYMFYFNLKLAKRIKMCFQPLSADQRRLFEVHNEALKRL